MEGLKVSWGKNPGRMGPIKVLGIKPEGLYVAWMLSDESYMFSTQVHWHELWRATVPHIEGNCPFCPRRIWTKVYAPTGAIKHKISYQPNQSLNLPNSFKSNTLIWEPRILEIPDGIASLIKLAKQGDVYALWRGGKANNAPLCFRRMEEHGLAAPGFEAFDVRPHMEKIWGLAAQRNGPLDRGIEGGGS